MDNMILTANNVGIKLQDNIEPIKNISLSIEKGESYGLAGECGSGKSTFAKMILGLYPANSVLAGQIFFDGKDLSKLDKSSWQRIRGKEIGYVPQNFMEALNPVLTIKTQMIDHLMAHDENMNEKKAIEYSLELFSSLGIPSPKDKLVSYNHQLSGGVRQRILIAMSISSSPKLLICDETTTALDVTTQAVVLQHIKRYCNTAKCSLLIISHDLALLSNVTDRIGIMYKGNLIEEGVTYEVFKTPIHSYTQSLVSSTTL